MAIRGFTALLSGFIAESVTILAFHALIHPTITSLVRSSKDALHANQEPNTLNNKACRSFLAPSSWFSLCPGSTCLPCESPLQRAYGSDQVVYARYSF